jgi:two-component system sensor histidine kinase KdpD
MQFPTVYFAKRAPAQKALLSAGCATMGVVLMTAFIAWGSLAQRVDNIGMLYLLVVMLTALMLGRFAAILASLEAFVAFDYCFVQPTQQLMVFDPSEWLSLCIFLLTATVTGQLTVMLVNRIEEHDQSRRETEALAQASYAVASQLDLNKALQSVLDQIAKVIAPEALQIIIIDEDGKLRANEGEIIVPPDAVQWVISAKQPMIKDDAILQPIIVEEKVLGALFLKPKVPVASEGEKRVIVSLANLAGLVIQRDRLMKIEAQSEAVLKTERLKSALLSMVSHDFRSPLTSIKTSVNSMLFHGRDIEPALQNRLLTAVDSETDRLNHLIDNILDLSCLEAGVLDLKQEETPLAELVESALNTLSQDENDRITVTIGIGASEINVDCVLMAQVLRNLLENALKYSPQESKVELVTFLEAAESPATGDRLAIEIRDRGRGLPKSEEAMVFTPFFRAPDVQESSIPGMGLGLALSKGLVEAHQGVLSAYNREAGGAVFKISLPLETRDKVEDESTDNR